MKIKRRMKVFEEEEEDDWEFKCCGVSGYDAYLAECIISKEEGNVHEKENRNVDSKPTEVKRRSTIKESSSGPERVTTEAQQRGGLQRRGKLVRWWTNLS